ncbi:hypothetical protein IP84_12030 [beta proteobacterium AAP99]|nr:hypothetical protein IP84_12030 [beta proteobacterium AAP99]
MKDLACGADHIFVGRVVSVDLIDGHGQLIEDESAGTGPGLSNTLRLHIQVLETVTSTSTQEPKVLKVPLDPMMHYSLGQVRNAHAEPSDPRLIFLRGPDYLPIIAGRFMWSLDARKEALALRAQCGM